WSPGQPPPHQGRSIGRIPRTGAKLLACTEAGYWAIRRISFVAHPLRNRIGAQLATDELRNTLMTMRHLVALLEADQRPPND
ncbi:MAG: hypothetical protein K0R13_175, partial [Propionibacteriaceae bacterium]|nr:hypothetical protein [Propionibacteriaceae bacterium]